MAAGLVTAVGKFVTLVAGTVVGGSVEAASGATVAATPPHAIINPESKIQDYREYGFVRQMGQESHVNTLH